VPLEARALLEYIAGTYCAMQAYFAAMYYAGLRPAEARNIRKRDLHLPTGGWGELVIDGSFQFVPSQWTDSGSYGEERGLKHRPEGDWRPVPLAPGAEGLVFVGDRNGRLRRQNFRSVWIKAQIDAGVTPVHFHDLRHSGT
jgi:integrase